MVCGPAVRFEIAAVLAHAVAPGQVPPVVNDTGEPSAVPVPEGPSQNCTVPVADAELICAVKVTASPTFDGLREEITVVVVFVLLLTVWPGGSGRILPVPESKLPSLF